MGEPMEEVTKIVEEAKAPGTFNILNVLKERAYPRDEAVAYLDEQAAYDASKLDERIKELTVSADLTNQDKIDELIAKREEAIARLEKSKYTFEIVGISEGMRADLNEEAIKKFPMEFEEDKNPFTGEVTKRELENKERDRLFTNLLWHASIGKITAPDGAVQESVSISDIEAFRDLLPLAAIGGITQSIEKLRVATAVFMMSVDEDFLAKS